MPRLSPDEFVEKHNRRLKGALEDMRIGVTKVSSSPTVAAAGKQAKMLSRLTESVNDGTWAAGLKRVSLEDWKADMLEKGIPRVSGGVDRAAAKVRDFATQVLPYIDNLKATIDKMPDVTLEDSIGRMTSFTRGMSKFKKK